MNPPRAYLALVGSAAAVIVAAGIGAAAWLIGPAFLAWVIVVVIAPSAGGSGAPGSPPGSPPPCSWCWSTASWS